VSDIASGPDGAPVQLSVDHDAAADSGADFDEEQVRDLRIVLLVFPQRHEVDVVVDDRGCAVALRKVIGHGIVMPAGHERRADHRPGGELHRPRHADRDGPYVLRVASDLGEQLTEPLIDPAEYLLGVLSMSLSSIVLARRCPPRALTASVARVAPRSAVRIKPTSGFRRNSSAGRPPLEGAAPSSKIRPAVSSSSMRWATVDRASWVCWARAARVTADLAAICNHGPPDRVVGAQQAPQSAYGSR
jgi:hypothetical protein